MIRFLLILPVMLVLAACVQTTVTPPVVPVLIPGVIGTCPAPAPDPPKPPPILSVERLRLFAQEAEAARVHDKAALRECTMRLRRATAVLDDARAATP